MGKVIDQDLRRRVAEKIDRALGMPPVAPELLGDGIVVSPAFLQQIRGLIATDGRRHMETQGV